MPHCPSCGRYVAPCQACPHCGARLSGRIPIPFIKIAAAVLATVGLAALWLLATHAEVPLVQIGQVGPTMNLAYVRLQGRCTHAPSYDPKDEVLSFWIEDDTGEIRVSAYRAETRQILAQNRVPALGDRVQVAGTLRVREDWLSLTLDVPEQLEISRAKPVDRAIGSIGLQDQYLRVRVRGQVRSVRAPYEGLTLITVRDETGTIPIAVSDDLLALSGNSSAAENLPSSAGPMTAHGVALSTGQPVEVVAAVSLYGDTPQLIPASLADVARLGEPVRIAAVNSVGQLTSADAGQLVAMRGTVTQVDPFSAGVKLTLDDTTGEVIALLWQSLYDELPDPTALDVGAEVQVRGEVSRYRGELELIPELADDVRRLATAPPPAEMTAGALTRADLGRVVTMRGTVGPPDVFSAGVKFPLDDGTGQVSLLLWDDVHQHAPKELGAGAQVVATGQVAAYQGELELIPRNAGEIRVTGRATATPPGATPQPTPTPPPTATPAVTPTRSTTATPGVPPTPDLEMTPIGAITAGHVGQEATVEGTVIDAASFSTGFKFTLDDGTGQIQLLMWHQVYDDCWDALEINLGAQVRATGEVGQYEGQLQIQPAFGGDVQVVEPTAAWTTPREIGTLTAGDEGQRVTIEGQVVRIEGLRTAVKVFIRDATGETLVFVWRTTLDRIPDNAALGTPGSRVRVTGVVELYQGNLEVVPALPNDVVVLAIP